ncbi:hypothetical protein [Pedobacter nutrimenti]|uniref:hypothetical protein n=1 Tax=Pedobacter nutrimenti TaxID=1241337 RepID=UPI00292DDB6E|nr:hypothetical protein [Pedobacter nutrimenti]
MNIQVSFIIALKAEKLIRKSMQSIIDLTIVNPTKGLELIIEREKYNKISEVNYPYDNGYCTALTIGKIKSYEQ